MPQMSPLMWMILFVMFSSTLLISMVKTYFNNMKSDVKEMSNENTSLKSSMNWMW